MKEIIKVETADTVKFFYSEKDSNISNEKPNFEEEVVPLSEYEDYEQEQKPNINGLLNVENPELTNSQTIEHTTITEDSSCDEGQLQDSKEIVQQYINSTGNIGSEDFRENRDRVDDESQDNIPLSAVEKRPVIQDKEFNSPDPKRLLPKKRNYEDYENEDDIPLSEWKKHLMIIKEKAGTTLASCDDHEKSLGKKPRSKKRKPKVPTIYKCHLCSYETPVGVSLEVHIKGVHLNIRDFKCTFCNYSCIANSTLRNHIMAVHSKQKDYKCTRCDFACFKKQSLRNHEISIHREKGGLTCSFCGKVLIGRTKLNIHVKAVHMNIKEHKCEICSFKTSLNGNLVRHMRGVHSNTKNFACHLCEFRTFANSDLKSHINGVHLKLKKFKCHLCSYAASLKGNLNRHLDNVHYEKKKHQCSICGYSSFHFYILRDHISTIHSEATFKCKLCEKSFGSSRSLIQHKTVVHLKDQGHKCEICNYTAYRKCDVKKHFETVHLPKKKSKN